MKRPTHTREQRWPFTRNSLSLVAAMLVACSAEPGNQDETPHAQEASQEIVFSNVHGQ